MMGVLLLEFCSGKKCEPLSRLVDHGRGTVLAGGDADHFLVGVFLGQLTGIQAVPGEKGQGDGQAGAFVTVIKNVSLGDVVQLSLIHI